MKPVFHIALKSLFLLYPFLIFLSLQKGLPLRLVAFFLFFIVLFQFLSQKIVILKNLLFFVMLGILIATFYYDTDIFLKAYPVFISSGLLVAFALSLKFPPTIIEKIARLKNADLSDYAISYIRKVTKIWCVFFLFNATAAFCTMFMSAQIWLLYNGLISYLLVGSLMGIEFLVRRQHMKRENQ